MFPLNGPNVFNTRNHEAYFVTPARTKRLANSAIPSMQRILNSWHAIDCYSICKCKPWIVTNCIMDNKPLSLSLSLWVHFTFCCPECTHFARLFCIHVDACRSNQVIVPSARILLGPVCTNFTQTQNTNKEINLPHETAHTSLRPRIPIWKVNSPLPVTDENMAWRSPNLPTGRSPGQVFISKW